MYENKEGGKHTQRIMNHAAKGAHLKIVKWLYENRKEACAIDDVINYAVAKGHLNIVEWVYENGKGGWAISAMNLAASKGHLHIVKWIYKNEGGSGHYPISHLAWGVDNKNRSEFTKWMYEFDSTNFRTEM